MVGCGRERGTLRIMAMSLILSTCMFDVCLSGVAPTLTFTPSHRPVTGQNLVITCAGATDVYMMTIYQIKGGVKSDFAYQTSETECRGSGSLRSGASVSCGRGWRLSVNMPRASPDDSAMYTCTTTFNNVADQDESSSQNVTVLVLPSEPVISGTLAVEEGDQLRLTCDGATTPSVPGNYPVTSPVTYQWRRDTHNIHNVPTEDLKQYVVVRTNSTHGGSYRCIARNEAGSKESPPVSVQIYYLPETVRVSSLKLSRLEGESEVFSCTATDANPTPTLRLMRRSGPETREIVSKVTLSLTHTYTLKRDDNQAQFYCEASSNTMSDRSRKSQSITYNVTYPPRVTVEMIRDTVVENESLKVTCNAFDGNPPDDYKYKWQFRQSDSSSSYTTLDQTSRDLVLRHVQYNEAGYYKCTATNAAGSEWNEKQLRVKFSPRVVLKPELQVAGEVGKTARFVLKLIANPLPKTVIWSKDGQVISESNTHYRQKNQVTSENYMGVRQYDVSLIIPHVDEDIHYGVYQCTVENEVNDKTWNFTLKEAGPPLRPTGLHAREVTASSITLQWTSEFTGGSAQTFSIMYKTADAKWPENDQITGIVDRGYKVEIHHRIRDLEPKTWYMFRVRSTNSYPGNNRSPYSGIHSEQTLELPKTDHLKAYRDGNQITVSWRKPTGTYNGVKVEYCISGIRKCNNHTVLDFGKHTAQFTVEGGKTFIYYLHLMVNKEVLFTSEPFHAEKAPIRTSQIGFIAGGGGLFIIIIVVIVVIICCVRRKKRAKKKQEMELHNRANVRTESNRALMGTDNAALNNTPHRSFNDLSHGVATQHLDVANLRKQANIPGPDVVPNSDQPENEYVNTVVTSVPVGQVEPMPRHSKEYANLVVPSRNNTGIPDAPIQSVSPEGIVYTQVFCTIPMKTALPIPAHPVNGADHYAKIDVSRSAAQARLHRNQPPPYQPRTQETQPCPQEGQNHQRSPTNDEVGNDNQISQSIGAHMTGSVQLDGFDNSVEDVV